MSCATKLTFTVQLLDKGQDYGHQIQHAVMSDLGKALLRLNNTVPASSYSTSAGVAKVNERSCSEWTEWEREVRNRRDNCSAVWVIVSAWPIQRSTLIRLRIAVCAVTWLTAQSSNRKLKRNSVIVDLYDHQETRGWCCFVYCVLL